MTIGILLAHLGTPDAPTAQALRPYLAQFLSDRRVIDYPPLLWGALLHGVILNTRPRRSAALYARIWTPQGSPLRVYAEAQAAGLQTRLGDGFRVALGMRYGTPSIASALDELVAQGIERLLVFTAFPQYSCTTSASIYDAVHAALGVRRRFVPALRFVPPYYAHPGYVAALAQTVCAAFARDGVPDKLLLSYHGIPARYAHTGDPYPAHCQATTEALVAALNLDAGQWTMSFQSRFGPERWLEPATDATLERLARAGVRTVAVLCPGFTADCLETLDELGNEARETFLHAGGAALRLIPCLNDHPAWLDALADLARAETGGWG